MALCPVTASAGAPVPGNHFGPCGYFCTLPWVISCSVSCASTDDLPGSVQATMRSRGVVGGLTSPTEHPATATAERRKKPDKTETGARYGGSGGGCPARTSAGPRAGRAEKLPGVERHYQDTIVRPVVFDDHADLLDPATLQELRRLFPGGSAAMWGVMPGKNGVNLPEIRKMEPGAWVFFSGDKRLYLGATIAVTWRSPQLAERLWGADPDSGTWEYMYALAGLRDFDMPVEELRDLLGWKTTRNIMRLQTVNTAEADLLEQHFSLEPYTPPPSGGHGPAGQPPVLAGVHSDTASGEDLLNNEADVEMLAQLVAATVTTPPLAVALLGEWGAGKSSFIRQMSSRVDQLAALAAQDPAHSARPCARPTARRTCPPVSSPGSAD